MKKYEQPIIEVFIFDRNDVITSSPTIEGDDNVIEPGEGWDSIFGGN